MAMATTMGMAMLGSCRAETKVASPSGKLWMAMARAVITPMRISLVVWPVSASKDLTSWGFSSEGMHLSMRAIRSIPPKKAMTVLQLPHFSPSSAWSASWAWEISIMET